MLSDCGNAERLFSTKEYRLMADNENRWMDERNRYRRGDEDRNRWSAEGGDYRSGEYRERGRGEYGYGGRDYGARESGGRDYGRYGREDYGYGSREDYGGRELGGGRDYGRYGREEYGGGYGSRDYGAREAGGGRDYSRYGREDRGYGSREDYRGRDERGFWDRASDEVSSWFGDRDAERRRHEDELRSGQHRGRGPRGYARSDDRIRDDVNDRLTDDPFVDASEIDVSVQNGEVTLGGTVDNRQTKRRAEDVAENVSGVKHVQNNLRVRQQGSTGTSSWTSGSTGAGATTTGTTSATVTPGTSRTSGTSGTVESTRTSETSGTRT
jgi:osmotically-inducible protein OsmY